MSMLLQGESPPQTQNMMIWQPWDLLLLPDSSLATMKPTRKAWSMGILNNKLNKVLAERSICPGDRQLGHKQLVSEYPRSQQACAAAGQHELPRLSCGMPAMLLRGTPLCSLHCSLSFIIQMC